VKLLLDNNLSPRLARLLADIYPECAHVLDVGLERASDSAVWQFAAEHEFSIVSNDSDFHQRSLLYGAPPKVVWLRIGNCTVEESAAILRDRSIPIRSFIEDSSADFLILS
jgi:predicted nuclease of predicted toxin-antitoxin system